MENIERKVEQEIPVEDNYEEIDSLQDKMDILFMKHQLVASHEIDLKEAHSTQDNYGAFIDILNVALAEEPAFFLLDDEFIKSAEDVLYSKRFDYNRVENYNEIINEIIGRINSLKMVSPYIRDCQTRAYIGWNLDVRQLGTHISQADFYRVLAHDAILLQALINGDINGIEPYYFFSSTNYLTTIMPELYQEHPEMIDMTMQKLEQSIQKRWLWNWAERDFARETQKNLQKIKVKGE